MKRTELRRLTPLRRTAMSAVRSVLKRTPMKQSRPRPAVAPAVRTALAGRSGGLCEMRLAVADCQGRATDVSHRIATGAGGRKGAAKTEHDRLSNVIHACRACHNWCHHNVARAEDLGLMLREGDEPVEEWVFLPAHGGAVLLDDDGTWTEVS